LNILSLFNSQQYEDESLKQYYTRVEQMMTKSFPGEHNYIVDITGVEKFISGCREKQAAITAMDSKPRNMKEAYEYVVNALATRQAILGSSSRKVREVPIVRTMSVERGTMENLRKEMDEFHQRRGVHSKI
jgi:hypothetical protein